MRHGIEAHHRHPAHGFHPGADERIPGVHLNGSGRHMNGIHRRAAEAIDRCAGDGYREAGLENNEPRDVQALLAFRKRAAQDQIFYIARIDTGFGDQALHHL